MFKIWRGYEIDGSDSSYEILSPSKEKIIEFLKFYFKLKTINQNGKFIFKLHRQKFKHSEVKTEKIEILFEDLENFLDNLNFDDPTLINSTMKIEYSFISFNNLYPEVKREIISILEGNEKENKYIRPTVTDSNVFGEIAIYFFPEGNRKIEDLELKYFISENNYVFEINKNSNFSLDILVRLDEFEGNFLYNMLKIKEAFPEFKIDTKKIMKFRNEFVSSRVRYKIKERIFVKANDYNYFFEFLREKFKLTPFYTKWEIERHKLKEEELKLIKLHNLYDLSHYLKEPEYKIYDHNETPPDIKIIDGIGGKDFMNFNEYINFIYKLKDVKAVKNDCFRNTSNFRGIITIFNEKYNIMCGFEKRKNEIIFFMDIPANILNDVKRKLQMFEVY